MHVVGAEDGTKPALLFAAEREREREGEREREREKGRVGTVGGVSGGVYWLGSDDQRAVHAS